MNVTVLTVTFFKTSTAWTDLCLFSSFLKIKKKIHTKEIKEARSYAYKELSKNKR